jgi:DNA primase
MNAKLNLKLDKAVSQEFFVVLLSYMITRSTIDKIFAVSRIEEVVGDYVQLKRSGSGMGGLCPFHNEKTPSFKVNPSLGIYKCFGCSRGGNAVDFIMEMEKMSYPEALKHLAAKYQIEVEETYERSEERDQEAELRESLYVALEYAKNTFHNQMMEDDEGRRIGLSYFKERGLTEETIHAFNLGYALKGWDNFLKLPKSKAFGDSILLQAGLIKKRDREGEEDSYYDAFRERIIFPIQNVHGKTVAFGARMLNPDDRGPKYLNSPESPVYNKSAILYGLFESRKDIRIEDRCYLVEGYMDVVMLHQHGVKNVVASSGTSLTADQVKLMKRFTDNVTILYDGDKAGIKAALRGVDVLLEGGLNAHVVLFPEGEDPDSYCKANGGEAFKRYVVDMQEDFVLFKANLLLDEYGKDPIGQSKVTKEIVESIVLIQDPIKRQAYIRETASVLDFEEALIQQEVVRVRNQKKKSKRHFKETPEQAKAFLPDILPEAKVKDAAIAIERQLLEKLMRFGNENLTEEKTVAQFVFEEIRDAQYSFHSPMFEKVFDQASRYFLERGTLDEHFFVQHETIGKLAAEIYSQRFELSDAWEKNLELKIRTLEENFRDDVVNNINYIKLVQANKMIKNISERLKEASDVEDLQQIQKEYMELIVFKRELHQILGIEGALPSE